MNRKDFIKGLGLLALLPKWSFASKTAKVEVLRHTPNTRYETLLEFPTEQEAIEFVKNLYPRLISVTIAVSPLKEEKHGVKFIRSGYRGAIRNIIKTRYKHDEIVAQVFEIYDKRNNEVAMHTDFEPPWIYSSGRAWAIIENIRVNGKPVQLHETGRLPFYITEPFKASSTDIRYVDLQGNPLEYAMGINTSTGEVQA